VLTLDSSSDYALCSEVAVEARRSKVTCDPDLGGGTIVLDEGSTRLTQCSEGCHAATAGIGG
jgi:hypothetical protein